MGKPCKKSGGKKNRGTPKKKGGGNTVSGGTPQRLGADMYAALANGINYSSRAHCDLDFWFSLLLINVPDLISEPPIVTPSTKGIRVGGDFIFLFSFFHLLAVFFPISTFWLS